MQRQFNREEIRPKLVSSLSRVAKECVSTNRNIYASQQWSLKHLTFLLIEEIKSSHIILIHE